ncbi:hypothetical protein BpHYR1_052939 [Brachionus plicatilis]|uniref:Uncharacterized protein n=1 Tax=Brachionus plicatilis TaxID=10195 RepID=A0A3M7RSE3_BRAPC|nr:hypothetical protein BpHYR1_052939 [Brachionus plicatilis]
MIDKKPSFFSIPKQTFQKFKDENVKSGFCFYFLLKLANYFDEEYLKQMTMDQFLEHKSSPFSSSIISIGSGLHLALKKPQCLKQLLITDVGFQQRFHTFLLFLHIYHSTYFLRIKNKRAPKQQEKIDMQINKNKRITKKMKFRYYFGFEELTQSKTAQIIFENFPENLIEELPLFNVDDVNFQRVLEFFEKDHIDGWYAYDRNQLDFRKNKIKRINKNIFKNFKKLESIDFSHNLFEELPLFIEGDENVIAEINFGMETGSKE